MKQCKHDSHAIFMNSLNDPFVTLECCKIDLEKVMSVLSTNVTLYMLQRKEGHNIQRMHLKCMAASYRLTELLESSVGSLGIILVQSMPKRKTLMPVSLASFNSVSGSDQNLSLSCLNKIGYGLHICESPFPLSNILGTSCLGKW
jgi:hypothetical protein